MENMKCLSKYPNMCEQGLIHAVSSKIYKYQLEILKLSPMFGNVSFLLFFPKLNRPEATLSTEF